MTVLTLLAWQQIAPPSVVGADAPLNRFSAERAMVHVRTVAREPHPAGSAANDAVRAYLVEQLRRQGLPPQIQTAVVDPPFVEPFLLHNILARLSGTGGGSTVLLVAHYDSSPAGSGAGDDAAGVATLLETLRALRSGPPLRGDLLLLFTDAEEMGMLGATAFVEANPELLRDVDVVLNFEARGSGGPSYMFETSAGNADLVAALARASPWPIGSSLTYEVYRRMPNNTDFTVFRDAGLRGMNFAFINGFVNYHTAHDTPENLDPRSLQHHGSYALSLARHFANAPEPARRLHDAVYFSLLPLGLIHYPATWVWPLTAVAVAGFAAVVVLGLRRGRLSLRGLLVGAGAFLFTAAVTVEGLSLLPKVLPLVHRGPLLTAARGATYNAHLYAWSFVLLSVGVTGALYALWLRRWRVEDLTVGAWLWWLVCCVVVAAVVPGASFLFVWPLLAGLLAAVLWVGMPKPDAMGRLAVMALPPLAGFVFVAPALFGFFTALNVRQYWIVAILLMLLLALLLPIFKVLVTPSRWIIPVGFAAAGVALALYAGLTAPG